MCAANAYCLVLMAAAGVAAGCTTVGMDTGERERVDYGEPVSLELCLLKTDDVAQQRADLFVADIVKEMQPFGIAVTVPWMRPWKRPAFQVNGIIAELMTHPLEPPCDRLVALVDRHAGDFLWGLLLPEVLGAVEEVTHTHGYVVANVGSANQVFSSVEGTAIHEFYHLLGCGHDVSKSKCYHDIAALKASRPADSDFLPGKDEKGNYLLTRTAVDEALQAYLKDKEQRKTEE